MIYADSKIKTIGDHRYMPPSHNSEIHATIDPFDRAQVNPASYDLTLYPRLMVAPRGGDRTMALDLREVKPTYLHRRKLYDDDAYVVEPGEFLLGCTVENVALGNDIVARVEGKSSLARVGLAVHVTGGFIDPGFRGQITLEIVNLFHRPLIIYPYMRIAQIAFSQMTGEVEQGYASTGHYQGQMGPTLSRYKTDLRMPNWHTCLECDWEGTDEDWEIQVQQERYCLTEGCSGYQRTCPSDHCLDCGGST